MPYINQALVTDRKLATGDFLSALEEFIRRLRDSEEKWEARGLRAWAAESRAMRQHAESLLLLHRGR